MDKRHLHILWTNADPTTGKLMVMMYAKYSMRNHWWDKVTVILWGATTKLMAESEEMRNAINAVFPGVFDADGKLNRQKLGEEVFSRRERLTTLNDIVYRYVVPEVQRQLGNGPGLYAVDAINLLESGLAELCDRTIAVTAPTELRVRRIMARDGISEQYARMRITSQKSDEYYRTKCSYELTNGAETPEGFQAEAREFLRRLLESIREERSHGKE